MAGASSLAEAVANALPARAPGAPAWPSSYPCPSEKSVVPNSSHDSLPFQLRVFEVYQQAKFQSSNRHVADHLGHMALVKHRDHFGVHPPTIKSGINNPTC